MKQIKYITLIATALILLGGCEPTTPTPTPTPIQTTTPTTTPPIERTPSPTPIQTITPTPTATPIYKEFYGRWKNLNTGMIEKIDKNYNYSITSLGDNFIKVKKGDKEFMLLRYGSANGTIKGQLYSDVSSIQKSSQKKISKKIKNKEFRVTIDDGVKKETVEVQDNGTFSFSGVHSGDSVRVTIRRKRGGFEDDILPPRESEDNRTSNEDENSSEPKEEGEVIIDEDFPTHDTNTNLGTFIVPNEDSNPKPNDQPYNLKLTKTDIQDEDDRYMYSEGSYSGELTYKNFGKTEAIGLNYTLSTKDSYIEDVDLEVKTGTLLPDESVNIPFTVSFNMLDKIKHTVKLDFLVRDATGKSIMLDYVYLDIYQSSIWVNLKAKTSNIKGYFITPEHEVIDVDSSNMRVRLPKRPNDTYYFVVTQPTDIKEETLYSIGVDVNASEFGNFHETSIYEPNNSENTATKLQVNESIRSFIHKGDIDFYTFDFQSDNSFINPPNLPFK